MSLRKAQHWLNPPKVCKSNLNTALSHCTASWHFSALHYQFQMAPIIRENVCVLDNFSAWSSINRINGQKCHQKKMTWMTCMMHGMVPCSCCTSRSSTGLQVGKSRFVMVAMTWKVYDWTHVFASFVMETTSEWKVWPKHWKVNTAWSSRPQPNVSSSHGFNDKFGLGWLPFRTPSVSCHSARLNIGSTLQRSLKVTCTLHCRTALPLGISVRFIISFKWPPSYVKTSASWTISLREVASIESMGKNAIQKNDMDDLHDARHGPLFMLYLKKLDWTAGRKVQVRHGRHDMEGLRLNTCFCQLCHGNHEWMKGLAEALEVNTAWSSRPQPNVSSSHGFNDKFGLGTFGLTSFQNTFSIMSLRKAQHWLNPPKVCKSNLHTALSHCTASWHFSALHFQFQMAPIIRENVCVLDNFSAWSSINRINGQKCHQKKWHWWPAWCTAWSLVHAVPQEARLDCRSESPGSSWSPWHGRSTTEHMLLPALSWKPRVNERSGRSLGGQHGVIFKAPAKRFIEPWLQWQIWFGHFWAGFLSEHPQYHVTLQGSTLAQPAHCTVALQFETCEKSGGLLGAQQLPFQVVWQSREANTPLTHISGILSQKPWRPWWSARLRPGPSAVHLEGSTKRGIGWHHVAPMAWLDQHERFNHTIIVPMRIVNSTWDGEIVSGYCYMLMMLMAISMWSTLLCGFDQQHLGILDHRMW